MARTEVSKMVVIEEKCGLDMSSYQDPSKSDCNGTNHHNQANDLYNSDVFVTGADGLSNGGVTGKHVAVGDSSVPPEPEGSQIEKIGAVIKKVQHLNDGVNENVELSSRDTLVDYSTCKLESSHDDIEEFQVSVTDSPDVHTCKIEISPGKEVIQVSVADSQEVLHTVIPESVAEADELVEYSNGKTESASKVEIKKDVDQNDEIEGVEGVTIADPPLPPVENQESQIRALELVAEIGENRESNNTFLNSSSSNSPNDGEDQSNISVIKAFEEQQRSEDVVVDVDDQELQSVDVEAEDEAKSTRELAEVEEHEVSTSSLGLESFSINSEYQTLEEEAKMDFSLNARENQQRDTGASNTVQDMGEETDESSSVGVNSGSHVQPTCSILEEKNDYSSLSEVENDTQYHEESQEQYVGSNDSHVQTTSDLVLEGKYELYEVENSAQYHEESQEQLVECNNDSHVQPTCNLVEEENDDSSGSEVEIGAQYHEESEEPPILSSDSHVQSTCDLASEVKNEESSVSEAENGDIYHKEFQEQPVVSTIDCHLQITHDLVVEENNEDSAVSKVENDAPFYEESQEQFVVASTDSLGQITHDSVLEEKGEESYVSEANRSEYPEEHQEQPDGCGASHDTTPSETMTEASVPTQSNPAPNACSAQSGTEVSDVEEIGCGSSSPVGPESQIMENVGQGSVIPSSLGDASSGSDCALDLVVSEKEIAFEGGEEAHSETQLSTVKSKLGDSSQETPDVKLEPDNHVNDFSVRISGEKSDDVSVSYRTDISEGFNLNLDGAGKMELEVGGVKHMGEKLDCAAGKSKQNLSVQESQNTGNPQNEETYVASAGLSITNITNGEKCIKPKTKSFNFLIRTPRFDDENLREQARLAKLLVDEKTKLRDAIQLQIQEKRANSQINGIDYEFSKGEGRSARKLVRSKRMEIESLQSVINKAKNALSIADIDNQIRNMEHMIQHETLPLKEEKQLIREIKQLKQLHEQLSSSMGSQDEIKQALEQEEETEERLKILRKELDVLKNSVLKDGATAAEAGKKYDDENRKVKELQAQFRAADEVRQAAYAEWQNLRKELSKKSKYFFKYKDDAAVASNYAFSRDAEALYHLCTNQVGSFMELWNTNPDFRRDYAKFNVRSNIRRFGTLDCRSLGPDEEPSSIPSYAEERGNRMASTPAGVGLAPRIPSVESKQKISSENVTSDSKLIEKVMELKSQKVLNGAINIQVNGFDVHTRSDLSDEVHEVPIKSREEIESMRKAEEMRREKAEAMLKEQRRLEALEKANEARERKKRQAEKLQQRAELKIQKEAEQRVKEREKRLRKKERKRAGATDANDSNNICETTPSSESAAENSKDREVKDMAAAKKGPKPWLLAKQQSKTKSIPPPLRNRNKKKLQQWMWVGITSFIILVLFWLGNVGIFSNVALTRRDPVY